MVLLLDRTTATRVSALTRDLQSVPGRLAVRAAIFAVVGGATRAIGMSTFVFFAHVQYLQTSIQFAVYISPGIRTTWICAIIGATEGSRPFTKFSEAEELIREACPSATNQLPQHECWASINDARIQWTGASTPHLSGVASSASPYSYVLEQWSPAPWESQVSASPALCQSELARPEDAEEAFAWA
jgi:hypothetical protein